MCFVRATLDKLRVVLQRLPNNNVKRSGLITNNILNFICRTKSQATVEIKRRASIHLLPGHTYRYEPLLSKVLTRNFLDSQTDCLDYVLEFVLKAYHQMASAASSSAASLCQAGHSKYASDVAETGVLSSPNPVISAGRIPSCMNNILRAVLTRLLQKSFR